EPGIHAGVDGNLRPPAGNADLRIRSHRGLRVAGHVQLRHDGDVARGGIGHHGANLLLRVETAVALRLAVMAGAGRRAPGADLRQLGVALDLDAPALVV